MFAEVSEEAGTAARDTAVRICWAQWAALGSLAASRKAPDQTAIVDPEALVLLSLVVRKSEVRLGDLVAWWARTSAHLMSVKRLRTLSRQLPPGMGAQCLAEFAALAAEAGDRRWKRHAQGTPHEWVRAGRPDTAPDLIAPAALWPRLRAGFGVGAKADVLAFLLGLRGASASVPEIARATHYTQVAVRRATAEMGVARLLRETPGRPVGYLAPVRPWAELLELTGGDSEERGMAEVRVPRWRYWAGVFSFLVWVADWSARAPFSEGNEVHTMASEARDIVTRHARVLDVAGVRSPAMDRHRGKEGPLGLLETTRAVGRWIEDGGVAGV